MQKNNITDAIANMKKATEIMAQAVVMLSQSTAAIEQTLSEKEEETPKVIFSDNFSINKPKMEEMVRYIAVKFAGRDTVYTYKTAIRDLRIGEVVIVPQGNHDAVAVVVGVDTIDMPYTGGKLITKREFDMSKEEITPRMRQDYKVLIENRKNSDFYKISIPAEPTPQDNFIVSVIYEDSRDNKEYTYLTNNSKFAKNETVIVPTGPFNLPKKAKVSRYLDTLPLDVVGYKRVHGRAKDFKEFA